MRRPLTPPAPGRSPGAPVAEGAAAAASGEPLLFPLAPSVAGRELSAPAEAARSLLSGGVG